MLILAVAVNSCQKQKFETPALSEFAAGPTSNTGTYFITSDPGTEFKIPIGITTSANKDRVINFTVTSPSGAVDGTQYTLGTSSITIPAGKIQDSIAVKGIYSAYPANKIDTLIFTISGGDVSAFNGYDKYTLMMQKYCDVISNDLVGDFANSEDEGSSNNPYTINVSNWTSTGPTTATITIKNLGATPDAGFGPFPPGDPVLTGLTAKLDWSDPSNFMVTVPSQPYSSDQYGYGPATISGSGSFSSCQDTYSITFTISVSAGNFTPLTTTLAR
jgi:hypothetical protein